MKRFIIALVAAVFFFASTQSQAQAMPAAKAYELRIFTANTGRLADLQALIAGPGLQLFAKHGIENVFDGTVLEGAAIDGADAPNMLVCILAHASQGHAVKDWSALEADPTWKAAIASADKNGPILAKPANSLLLATTDFSPTPHPSTAASAPRLFELRKYNTGQDGLQNTVDEFKEGLADILVKVGMTPVIYWTAADRSSFVYLLAHKDREAARASWKAFLPEFRPFMTEFNTRHGIAGPPAPGTAPAQGAAPRRAPDDNRFLVPTDFSPLK